MTLATRYPAATTGVRAPDFSLETPGGPPITLSDLNARRTLIIFQRHLG